MYFSRHHSFLGKTDSFSIYQFVITTAEEFYESPEFYIHLISN
jgi:hypothetical protein